MKNKYIKRRYVVEKSFTETWIWNEKASKWIGQKYFCKCKLSFYRYGDLRNHQIVKSHIKVIVD